MSYLAKNSRIRLLEPLLRIGIAQGTITGDLKGKTTEPDREKIVDMFGFLDAVESNLETSVG